MLHSIGIAVVVAIVALLAYAATRPDTFRLQRSTSIKAPPEKIFPLINDFHNTMVGKDFEAGLANMKAAAEK
jgi:hypothetical protein